MKYFTLISALLFSAWPMSGIAQAEEREKTFELAQAGTDLDFLFAEDELFISATQSARTLGKAPAIATVISAKHLKEMGARNIFDALVTVPGFGYSYLNNISTESDLEVRGIKSRMEKVLLMIDGHRINNPFLGSFNHLFDELPIEQIKRIEVIRGPGSALYGAGAFVGVINIIMKKPGDFTGLQMTAGGGNDQRTHGNVLAGVGSADAGLVLNYDRMDTNGSRQFIASDAAGNSGYTHFWRSTDTAHMIAEYNKFTFSGLYLEKRRGTPLSITNFIDTRTEIKNKQVYGTMAYHDKVGAVDIEAKVAFDQFWWDAKWAIDLPSFTTGHPLLKNQTYSEEIKLQFEPLDSHFVTIGLAQDHQRQFDVRHIVNGVDVSAGGNHNQNAKRRVFAAYFQDEWEVSRNFIVTAGLRFDRYNDIGSTTNPRLAAVWSVTDDVDVKFLYGSAFRAPSFLEMYEINNPASVGNPNLKPEKMRSFEAGLVWKMNHNYQLNLNAFHNRFTDRIVATAPLTINSGGATIWGVESELKADWSEYLYGYLNYSYQNSKDQLTQIALADVPVHRIKAGVNVGFFDDVLNVNAAIRWNGKRSRALNDARASMPATTIADLALSTNKLMQDMKLTFKVHNLLDANVFDASPASVQAGYPRPGRTLLAEAEYTY